MIRNEAETRNRLINPAIQSIGWVWPLVREDGSAKRVDTIDGQPVLSKLGRVDYLLQVRFNLDTSPAPVAIVMAKGEEYTPVHGLEQAKLYAVCERLNVPLVMSSNGHQWVSFDRQTGITSPSRPTAEFASAEALRNRNVAAVAFGLQGDVARPLLTPDKTTAGAPRHYRDAAIRAALETLALCERRGEPKRALLSLATGAGKTIIAAALHRRLPT